MIIHARIAFIQFSMAAIDFSSIDIAVRHLRTHLHREGTF